MYLSSPLSFFKMRPFDRGQLVSLDSPSRSKGELLLTNHIIPEKSESDCTVYCAGMWCAANTQDVCVRLIVSVCARQKHHLCTFCHLSLSFSGKELD